MLFSEPVKIPAHYWGVNEKEINHPGDDPFATDMTFRNYADHRIDPTIEYFDPEDVKKGDTIYLGDWAHDWFAKHVHPKIKEPYILISNDSDAWHPNTSPWFIEASKTFVYDPKVAAWFCKNSLISTHPKITQIPIGQNIIYWGFCPDALFSKVNALAPDPFEREKTHLLYMAMQLASHSSRRGIAQLFQDQPYCFSRIRQLEHELVPREQFYEDLSQSVFTLAPPGYGPDTVRFWEALVLGCIPIVKHSELDDLYADLPVLFVNDWSEINEPFLINKWVEIREKKMSLEKAYFEYWKRKIDDVQKQVREGTHSFSALEAAKFSEETLSNLSTVIGMHTDSGDKLLCKGAVIGLRPFQIAARCDSLSSIYIQDEWGARAHEFASTPYAAFIPQDAVFPNYQKIATTNPSDNAYLLCAESPESTLHVFFDLIHLRHRLEQDLANAYHHLTSGSLICGSLGEDPYVKTVLEKFSIKHSQQIHHLGDIWFFKR